MRNPPLPPRSGGLLLALLPALLLGACGNEADEAPSGGAGAGAGDTLSTRYQREFVYLGERGASPLVVPFVFRAVQRGDSIQRTGRAGLAHGPTWDPFLDEAWSTPRVTGVWRVLPAGDLRLAVGGPADVEALWYQRGDRSLRLDLRRPISGWNQGNTARYRLVAADLRLGTESTPGVVLESLQILRPSGAGRDSDWLFLAAGDTLRLVLAESMTRESPGGGRGFAWAWTAEGERSWERAEVRWMETRSYEDARRDIPLHWSFRVAEAGLHGEVSAIGINPRVGPERPGRRAVEVRYTVEGWVEIEGRRSAVLGTVRHVQE